MPTKTNFNSYCINGVAEGCKYCVKGEKLVLFISGKCSRNCYYCSLSNKRKNKDVIFANERVCKTPKNAVEEAIESNAKGAGITGGDPFLFLDRTIAYAKALKRKFGKRFHIHIYLPTKLLTEQKLKKLSRYTDEVRFHPEFLSKKLNEKEIQAEIDKIKLAGKFFKKNSIGIELPMIPDKKEDILKFIIKISPYISFVNLNELEISDANFCYMTKNYKFNQGGYTINGSKNAGIFVLNRIKKLKTKLKVHLCTADTKNHYQFKNRLLKHDILEYGKRTEEGLVKYLAVYCRNKKELNKVKNSLKGEKFHLDIKKNRILLQEKTADALLKNKKRNCKIFLVEEFPTNDGLEVEKEELN
ncbi:MAG: radical SAM protein [Nanoarchaeota archaeon]|nr:radical SAM protein [Nanoarchaeota archaeon]